MGLRDLLSVVLGVRAADQWREHSAAISEIRDQIAATDARLKYAQSPEFEAELRAAVELKSRQQDERMLMLWGRIPPVRRVRPDKRTGIDRIDAQSGAERGVNELAAEVAKLYTAALVGGSYRRWRMALRWYEPKPGEAMSPRAAEILSEAAFTAYTSWVAEFRELDGPLLDDLIVAAGADTMASSSEMEWTRQGLGLS